jgi:hypothetical protein
MGMGLGLDSSSASLSTFLALRRDSSHGPVLVPAVGLLQICSGHDYNRELMSGRQETQPSWAIAMFKIAKAKQWLLNWRQKSGHTSRQVSFSNVKPL